MKGEFIVAAPAAANRTMGNAREIHRNNEVSSGQLAAEPPALPPRPLASENHLTPQHDHLHQDEGTPVTVEHSAIPPADCFRSSKQRPDGRTTDHRPLTARRRCHRCHQCRRCRRCRRSNALRSPTRIQSFNDAIRTELA